MTKLDDFDDGDFVTIVEVYAREPDKIGSRYLTGSAELMQWERAIMYSGMPLMIVSKSLPFLCCRTINNDNSGLATIALNSHRLGLQRVTHEYSEAMYTGIFGPKAFKQVTDSLTNPPAQAWDATPEVEFKHNEWGCDCPGECVNTPYVINEGPNGLFATPLPGEFLNEVLGPLPPSNATPNSVREQYRNGRTCPKCGHDKLHIRLSEGPHKKWKAICPRCDWRGPAPAAQLAPKGPLF